MTFIPISGGGGGSGVIYDTFANRPAAGTAGRIFMPGDNGFPQLDNGTEWQNLVRGIPFKPPVSHTVLSTQTNFGSSTLTKANDVLTMDIATAAARNLRLAGKAIVSTNPVVTWGADLLTGMTLGGTTQGASTFTIGGIGVYMYRAAVGRYLVSTLQNDANDSSFPKVSHSFWDNPVNGFQAEETAKSHDKMFQDHGMPCLFRMRYVQADARVYVDMSPDRANTWIQIYQTPNAGWLGGDPTEWGVVGYTFGNAANQKLIGRFWHLDMVG
jgi:hypothetical protein